MPLISAVGRDQSCSITLMPSSPAGVVKSDRAEEGGDVEVERAPLRELAEARGDHALVEARQGHPAARVMHVGKQIGEHADGIARRPAIDAGMQVARRSGHSDLGESEPAQEGGDGGRVGVQLPGVADERKCRP